MTLAEFNELTLDLRCDAIYDWGFYVTNRKISDVNIVLYLMNGFFAEMVIKLSDNKVIEVKGFYKPELPTDYLDLLKKKNPFLATSINKGGGISMELAA